MTVRRTFITQIPPGSPIPNGEPRRYKNRDGYVRLRWYVSTYTYVECYEHRVVDGRVVSAEYERHHVNRVRDDNSAENLRTLTAEEHAQEHGDRELVDRMVALYASGMTTTEVGAAVGRDASQVSRHLAARGVAARRRDDYLPPIDLDQIRAWHAAGVRTSVMAQRTGRGVTSIAAALDQLGLPRFRPGRPADRHEESAYVRVQRNEVPPPEADADRPASRVA